MNLAEEINKKFLEISFGLVGNLILIGKTLGKINLRAPIEEVTWWRLTENDK